MARTRARTCLRRPLAGQESTLAGPVLFEDTCERREPTSVPRGMKAGAVPERARVPRSAAGVAGLWRPAPSVRVDSGLKAAFIAAPARDELVRSQVSDRV